MNIHIRTRFQKENKNRGQAFSNGRRAAKSQLDKREVSPTSGLGQQVRTKKSTRLVTILQKRVLFFVRAWPCAKNDTSVDPKQQVYFEIKKPPWVSVVWVVIACCICSKHDPCICSKQCTAPAGKKVFATQYLTYITKIALLRYNYTHSTLIWNPVFMSDTCVTLVWHLCDTSVTLV